MVLLTLLVFGSRECVFFFQQILLEPVTIACEYVCVRTRMWVRVCVCVCVSACVCVCVSVCMGPPPLSVAIQSQTPINVLVVTWLTGHVDRELKVGHQVVGIVGRDGQRVGVSQGAAHVNVGSHDPVTWGTQRGYTRSEPGEIQTPRPLQRQYNTLGRGFNHKSTTVEVNMEVCRY